MKKTLTILVATAAVALTAIAAPQPAQAGHHGGAVAAGVIGGLAAGAIVGSAIANSPPAYAYAPGPVYYAPGCYWTRERFWDGWRWRSHRVRVCR